MVNQLADEYTRYFSRGLQLRLCLRLDCLLRLIKTGSQRKSRPRQGGGGGDVPPVTGQEYHERYRHRVQGQFDKPGPPWRLAHVYQVMFSCL